MDTNLYEKRERIQNQQINTFIKGMDTDTTDSLISDSQYRMARNLRLTTNENSDDGELHMIEGVSDNIITNYFSDIIATTSIGNCGIILGVKNGEDGWGIYTFDKDLADYPERVFGPCNKFLTEPLSLVTRLENNNIKLYIASKNSSILSINLNHDETEIPKTIDYLGINDNIFVQPLQYVIQQGNGQFKAPVIQYAYRVYKLGGQSSQASPLTKLIQLSNDSIGYLQNDFIQKTINLTINTENIPDYIDYIQIFRISYVENGQQPIIDVVFDEPLRSNFIDIGQSIKTISVSEFTTTTNIQIKPQFIESKNNYLFAANITYDQNETDDLFKNATINYELIHDNYIIDQHNNIISGQYGRSLRRGEPYRYGVVFYTKDGKRTSVQCITDVIEVPDGNPIVKIHETSTSGSNNNIITTNEKYTTYEVERTGIKFTVNIPEEARTKCAGYEIVRCDRSFSDTTNISQGIVGACFYPTPLSGGIGGYSIVSPFMSMFKHTYKAAIGEGDHEVTLNSSINNGITYACPEYVYNTDDFKNNVKSVKNILKLNNVCKYNINSEQANEDGIDVTIVGKVDGTGIRFVENQIRPDLSPSIKTHHSSIQSYDRGIDLSILYPTAKLEGYTDIEHSINDISFIESPEYNSFSDGEDVKIQNAVGVVGNNNIVNWFAPDFYVGGEFDDSSNVTDRFKGDLSNYGKHYISSGKKAVLFDIKSDTTTSYSGGGTSSSGVNYGGHDTDVTTINVETEGFLNITVANLRKTQNNKYGGNSDTAKKSCVFYSYGNYKNWPESQNTDTVDVYDGDCYVSCFEYNSSHWWDSDIYNSNKCPVVYYVPLESSIDLTKTSGDLYSRSTSRFKSLFQDIPVNITGDSITYVQEKNAYLYNNAYSVTPSVISFVPITYTKLSTDSYNTRIYYSEKKQNGESIDSWYQFKSANYLDVDSSFGEITNLRLFKNTLLFWQEHATGILSVNERTILQDANDTNIILGNGDILQRYDYISTLYGMKKDDLCDTQSDQNLYWVDSWYKTLMQYSGGEHVNVLNKIKNVSNYINSIDIVLPKLVWDSKYKEILFNLFRNNSSKKGDSLVYSEVIQAFTAIYDLPFEYTILFPSVIFFIVNNKIYDRKNNFYPNNSINTYGNKITPVVEYVVNNNPIYNKTFDIQTFGGRFYGGGYSEDSSTPYGDKYARNNDALKHLTFTYKTPLKQNSSVTGEKVTNVEYDYKLVIPRDGDNPDWGNRLRGKTMQCKIESDSNNLDFALQYVTTKFRMSWT